MTETDRQLLEEISKRLTNLEQKHESRDQVDKELMHMFQAVKGSLTVLGWVERFSIWLAKMSVAGGILWYLLKISIEEAVRQKSAGN